MCLCPALLRNTAGFFLFARENSGYLLNFAEVTRKKKRQLDGGCRNIAFIYNIYVRRTSQSRKLALFKMWGYSAQDMLCVCHSVAALFPHLGMPVPLL